MLPLNVNKLWIYLLGHESASIKFQSIYVKSLQGHGLVYADLDIIVS